MPKKPKTKKHESHHDIPVKDLRPGKDLRAGGQKKEDPTITAPPPPNIIAV
jgi:hypothetical protein